MNPCSCGCGGTNGCFTEKLRYLRAHGLNVDPRATPSRRNTNPPRDTTDSNAWERGSVRDSRGLPVLDRNLEPIGQKEWVNNPAFAREYESLKSSHLPADQTRN